MNFRTLVENPACNPGCRACHYKGLGYSEQLERKRGWTLNQLGQWRGALREIAAAPEAERVGYRTKSWLRSSFIGGEISFGMYRALRVGGKWDQEFVSWDTCPLHSRAIRGMIVSLKKLLIEKAQVFAEESLEGIWMGNPHLVVVAKDAGFFQDLKLLDWRQVLVAPFDQAWFHCNPQVGRKVFSHLGIWPLADLHPERVKDASAARPVRAFRQVAQSLLKEARQKAISHLLTASPHLVLDLYCGTGDLSLSLPAQVGWVGIELSPEAVRYAQTLKPEGRSLHEAFVGAVEQRLGDRRVLSLVQGHYSLYVNPPRSGLTGEARDRVGDLVATRPPAAIAYLSCSASSLARDLPMFEELGFTVELLQPYDFFPQTEHFETLALLTRT